MGLRSLGIGRCSKKDSQARRGGGIGEEIPSHGLWGRVSKVVAGAPKKRERRKKLSGDCSRFNKVSLRDRYKKD